MDRDARTATVPSTAVPEARAPSTTLPGLPKTIGRFEIRRKLGAGGMGVVLVGRDDTLERDVALKLVLPGRNDSAARTRMLREAQAMAKVAHPNVVPIYEAGIHEGGLYIAMELVVGQSLTEWLSEKRSTREILEKFVQAGRGLAAAHAVGILHRDFKPANVLVGEDGRARVVDFGLARAVDVEDLAAEPGSAERARAREDVGAALVTDLTREGAIVGTPSYMSPEQLAGLASPASDQWSFAVALYRALYGSMPFTGDGLLGLMEAIVYKPLPTPPNTPDVPPRVTEIVMRALRRDPHERWPSMTEMVDALEQEMRVDPDSDPSRSRRQRRLLAAGVVLFALVSGAVAATRTSFGAQMGVRDVLVQSSLGAAAVVVGALAMRRTVLRDRHGRRMVLVMLLLLGGMSAHRAVVLLSEGDVPVVVVLRGDAILTGTIGVLAATVLERWFALAVLVMAAYIAFSFAVPEAAVIGFGSALIGCLALAIWFWRDPRGRVGGEDRTTPLTDRRSR